MRRSTPLLIIFSIALLLFGCGRAADPYHPRTALRQYVRAIKKNDSQAAYDMLSKKLKKQLSYKAFARKWSKNYAELRLQAADIEKQLAKEKAYAIDAKVRLGQKRTVALVHEEKRWHILTGVGGGVDAPTPRAAVAALVKALEGKNFTLFLKLLSKTRREKFVREMTLRLEKLKANLDRDFEVSGNRARLQYDPRYWIMLVKENGAWRVVEFN